MYPCEHCGLKQVGESYGCVACGYAQGDGSILCEDCASCAACDLCGEDCCVRCKEERPQCCGKILCGSGKKYPSAREQRKEFGVERDACVWKHTTKELPCGHPGCNLYTQGACYTCDKLKRKQTEDRAIKEDVKKVPELLGMVQSSSLAAVLTAWAGDPGRAARETKELERLRNFKRKR